LIDLARFATRLLFAGVLVLAPAPAPAEEEEMVDGIAAQVGNRVVLVSEVMQSISPQEIALREMGAPEQRIATLRADGLERMIEARLIEEMVKRTELYASEEEIDQAIEGIAAENGITTEQLYASVGFHGISKQAYRKQIKSDFEQRNVINAVVGSQINVDEAEVRALFEERFADQPQTGDAVHVRQLLITYEGKQSLGSEEVCAIVQTARDRIVGDESFTKVAAEVSDVAAMEGGDLGWIHMESVAPWMGDALGPMQSGELSEVLRLPFGCSILELVERRAVEPIRFEQAELRLQQELWEEKMASSYRNWIETLRAQTYIERRGYFANAARLGLPGESSGATSPARQP